LDVLLVVEKNLIPLKELIELQFLFQNSEQKIFLGFSFDLLIRTVGFFKRPGRSPNPNKLDKPPE